MVILWEITEKECVKKRESQCQQAYAKASKALGIIARTNKTPHVLLRLYKSLVRPHLEYCVPAWSPHYEDKVLLERVQHRFTKMVPGFRQLTYEQRLKRLGLWTLEERRNRADLLEVFKMYKGLSLTPFSRFFTISNVLSTRGQLAIQLNLSKVIVISTYVDSSSHSELLKDGMVYHNASSAAIPSTRSRMVSMQRGRSRWATS